MKRITLEQINARIHAVDYSQLCDYIYAQVENGSLKPVKASKTNGKKPALYREYWLITPYAEDTASHVDELKYQLSVEISTDYYLRHLEQYRADRVWVLKLNQYLMQRHDLNNEPAVSMNERSFQVWGREKFLQHEQGRKILKRCGIDVSQLSFYETSEPLAYYSHDRHTPQNLLILENKDTFYSMRRHLLSGQDTIFEIPFGTLIYGAGKGILRSFQDFSFCVEPYMQEKANRMYYFGDLDYEGIGIYERLAESFQTECHMEPFTKAYEKMLEKAAAYDELPLTKEKQNRNLSGCFFQYFSDEIVCRMEKILEDGRYIPQEILNITDFQ